eukprot:XP_001706490.1 Hypothetical protein GL50803_10189 [Giardia lamblia ATCC 50803]
MSTLCIAFLPQATALGDKDVSNLVVKGHRYPPSKQVDELYTEVHQRLGLTFPLCSHDVRPFCNKISCVRQKRYVDDASSEDLAHNFLDRFSSALAL